MKTLFFSLFLLTGFFSNFENLRASEDKQASYSDYLVYDFLSEQGLLSENSDKKTYEFEGPVTRPDGEVDGVYLRRMIDFASVGIPFKEKASNFLKEKYPLIDNEKSSFNPKAGIIFADIVRGQKKHKFAEYRDSKGNVKHIRYIFEAKVDPLLRRTVGADLEKVKEVIRKYKKDKEKLTEQEQEILTKLFEPLVEITKPVLKVSSKKINNSTRNSSKSDTMPVDSLNNNENVSQQSR